MGRRLDKRAPPPCTCSGLIQQFPSLAPGHNQLHVAAGLETISELPTHLRSLSGANAFFPSRSRYFAQVCAAFRKWCQHHGIPLHVCEQFSQLLEQLWQQHVHSMKSQHRTTWRPVQALRDIFAHQAVFHAEDHLPRHIMVFCPKGYFDSCLSTWNDPAVFQSLPGNTASWTAQMLKYIPVEIRKSYSWGVRKRFQLPRGFCFLKRKKLFQKGRSIISYRNSILELLLKGTASALQLMVSSVWKPALGLESLPQLWKRIHNFLSATHVSLHLVENNDDLIGFFNSVPQSAILDAVKCLLDDFCSQCGPVDIAVELRSLPNFEKAYVGKHRWGKSRHQKHIAQRHIVQIVQASFDTGIFWAAGSVRCQIDGTSIGNQISPVLSSLPVCRAEIAWARSFEAQRYQACFLCRYVDNRLVLCTGQDLLTPALQAFTSLHFYGDQICLEAVEDHSWLGFTLSAPNRTFLYKLSQNHHQIRNAESAGTLRLRLSGLRSRAALIRQYTWPKSQIKPTLDALRELFCRAGFQEHDLPSVNTLMKPKGR